MDEELSNCLKTSKPPRGRGVWGIEGISAILVNFSESSLKMPNSPVHVGFEDFGD